MAKRRFNVVEELENSSSYESSTESEGKDDEYVPYKRQRNESNNCKGSSDNIVSSTKELLEDKEHTYSREPMFICTNGKRYPKGLGKGSNFVEVNRSSRSVSRSRFQSVSSEGSSKKSPPYEDEGSFSKRKLVHSKTAVQARINREKKKKYLSALESDLESLREQNKILETKISSKDTLLDSLRNEIQYLRSVLVNSKEIGVLLKRICGTSGELNIKSSVITNPMLSPEDTNKAEETDDLDLTPSPLFDWPVNDAPSSGFEDIGEISDILPGVCLHVANRQVSIEFCATCNATSADAVK